MGEYQFWNKNNFTLITEPEPRSHIFQNHLVHTPLSIIKTRSCQTLIQAHKITVKFVQLNPFASIIDVDPSDSPTPQDE